MSFVKRFQTSLESLYKIPEKSSYVIAYSGGVDSHVLLHCCKQLNVTVRAVHVHHGLQNIADDWVKHCQNICSALSIPLDILYVDAQQKSGQSPEEAARSARYEALHKNLTVGDCLLTAQHLNDQAETLLLQLFRTASTAGLSAMPAYRQLDGFIHLRPLLPFSREEIEGYAKQNVLHWIEDPSNQDVTFDRNFLRKEILPALEQRWPEISTQLSTVASLQSNNLKVLEDMAAIDLANLINTPKHQLKTRIYEVVSVLSITGLKFLSSARRLNVLRYWVIKTIESHTVKKSPTRNLLEEIEKTLINAQQDANPEIIFSGYEFKKYQDELYLLKSVNDVNGLCELEWKPSSPLTIANLNIQLTTVNSVAKGIKNELLNSDLSIRFRQGGERFHPVARHHSQSLKKLFQEANIPPWERDSIPLLYSGDELVAVVGLWVSREFAVAEGEFGWGVDVEVHGK